MMMRRFQCGVLLAALACAGCQYIPGSPAANDKEARAGLDGLLSDAPAARLKDVRTVASTFEPGAKMFCGLVNPKNHMNAYAGWRRFIVNQGKELAAVSPDATDNSPREMIATQAAFETYYPSDQCPSSGYVPQGITAEVIKAAAKK